MGGGLMQLVAYGAQDIYLTGNPQITFFKVVYRRHTNFSMETIEQTINGTQALSLSAGTGTVTISRNGDLVHKVYVTVSGSSDMTKGSEIVNEVELEIGGQRIDRHYAEWNNIWNELSTDESKAIGLKSMQCDVGTGGSTSVNMTQVPLNFWFCRNPGLALPLIALQYHEVKLKFTWGTTTGDNSSTCKVMCDYIYLDTDERRRFAQVSHEYLIEQLQKQSADTSGSVKLNFNHPVKELIWTSNATNAYVNAQLKLNGHDRFSSQEEEYFQLRQPFDFHTAVPKQNLPTSAQLTTLDRQTSLGGITGASAGTLSAELTSAVPASSGGGVSTFTYDKDDLTFAIRGAGTAVLANAEISLGDQLAIVVTAAGSGGCFLAASLGKTFFASITGAVAQGDGSNGANAAGLVMTISRPVSTDLGTVVNFEAVDSQAGTDKIRVYKVTNGNSAQARTSQMTKKINVYSFALKPEEHQPSGTCNFSRIDTAKLDTGSGLEDEDNIYAVNYNVLRIMSGMGGLAYSN